MVVGPAGVEVGSALGPGEGRAGEELLAASLVLLHGSSSDFVLDELRLWQVEDLDARLGGDHEPVELLGEQNTVDWRVAVVLSEPLALDNIPDHDSAVARARGEESRVLDDVKSGDLSLVAGEGVQQGHVQVVPNLDRLIPRGSHAESGLSGMVEADHGDSILVVVLIDGELALGAGVPDLDVSVEGASDDLSVVGGEGN